MKQLKKKVITGNKITVHHSYFNPPPPCYCRTVLPCSSTNQAPATGSAWVRRAKATTASPWATRPNHRPTTASRSLPWQQDWRRCLRKARKCSDWFCFDWETECASALIHVYFWIQVCFVPIELLKYLKHSYDFKWFKWVQSEMCNTSMHRHWNRANSESVSFVPPKTYPADKKTFEFEISISQAFILKVQQRGLTVRTNSERDRDIRTWTSVML